MSSLRFFIRQEEYFGQLGQYYSVHGLTLVPAYEGPVRGHQVVVKTCYGQSEGGLLLINEGQSLQSGLKCLYVKSHRAYRTYDC